MNHSPDSVGTLYGIGVGPGDPELLTLKGLRLLRAVPVVYVPVARPGARSYAESIVADYLDRARQQVAPLVFVMRADQATRSHQWVRNAEIIARHLETGADAAFVTEGDPLFYSTFDHVASCLMELSPQARIVVVPGVSSLNAAAAGIRVPLADGDQRLAVVPATAGQTALRAALEDFECVAILKVSSALDLVLDTLEEAGRTRDAICVVRCGTSDEVVYADVRCLRGRQLDYFSLMLVRRPHADGRQHA